MTASSSASEPASPTTNVAAASHARASKDARHRSTARWLRRGIALLIALGLTAFIVMAWLPKPLPVEIRTVRSGPMRVTVDEVGRTRVKDRYVVSAPQLGSVGRIELRAGDTVTPGQRLARLVPTESPLLDARTRAQAQARVAAAAANQRLARASVERADLAAEHAAHDAQQMADLAQSGSVSTDTREHAAFEQRLRAEELASARFAAQVADHELDVARTALRPVGASKWDETLDIASPVAGRVLRVVQQNAGVVQAGTPLVEVGDPAALEIVSDILTSDAVHVRPGAHVTIERWGGDVPLKGHVRVVEPSAFTRVSALGVEEQRVDAIIDLDDPRDVWATLGDGYRVEVRIVTWETDAALALPSSAAFRRDEGWAVFRVEDGVARVRPITIGRRNAAEIQLVSGVEAGARVIVYPSDKIDEGVRVTDDARGGSARSE